MKRIIIFILIIILVTPTIKVKGQQEQKVIRILGIGNSHTKDSFRYLYQIFKEAGYDKVIIAHGFKAGIGLKMQYANYLSGRDYYAYWKYTGPAATKMKKWSLKDIVADEEWDYILIQQNSYTNANFKDYTGEFNISDFIDILARDCPSATFGLVTPHSRSAQFSDRKDQYFKLQKTGTKLMKYEPRFQFRINIG